MNTKEKKYLIREGQVMGATCALLLSELSPWALGAYLVLALLLWFWSLAGCLNTASPERAGE